MLAEKLQGAVGNASNPVYVEDVFSTYLYSGNSDTKTITNGIDLSTYGGLVWTKARETPNRNHCFIDTIRGRTKYISSNTTTAETTDSTLLSSFSTTGYVLDSNSTTSLTNGSGYKYVGWTFRKQAKFFDVVTFTSDGTTGVNIPHSLGSTPGCILLKSTNLGDNWLVYHRSVGLGKSLFLNLTSSTATQSNYWVSVTDTTFCSDFANSVGGGNWVAYLFAHDAGGFGTAGTDNVISCGSYEGNGSATGPSINLGYEPQWVMIKNASSTGSWMMLDNMRGMPVNLSENVIRANLPNPEFASECVSPTATGFNITTTNSDYNTSGGTYIYIAIRRPMKPPTTGTEVFGMSEQLSTNPSYQASFPVDFGFYKYRPGTQNWFVSSRLLQKTQLNFNTTDAESASSNFSFEYSNGWREGQSALSTVISYMFRRASTFFDVVCYTGTGASVQTSREHNLNAVPELIITKARTSISGGGFADGWWVYAKSLADIDSRRILFLNTNGAYSNSGVYNTPTTPTATQFSPYSYLNESAINYVSYLFATVAGVSKVGSYTGTGTTQQINCGFTGGARFILIKRTDSTGDWYVYDSNRGIVSGNDPYMLLNSTAAEVTNTDYVDTYSAGFEISSTAPAAINANGGSFIYLAIA